MSEKKYTGNVNPQARIPGQISPDAVVQLIKWYVEKNGIVSSGSSGSSETDPVFTASPAHGIAAGDITNWDNAYTRVYTADGMHDAYGYTRKSGTYNISGVWTFDEDVTIAENKKLTIKGTPSDQFVTHTSIGLWNSSSSLAGLSDTDITTPTSTDQVISPTAIDGNWVNKSVGSTGMKLTRTTIPENVTAAWQFSNVVGVDVGGQYVTAAKILSWDAAKVITDTALVDADFSSNGFMQRTGAGTYGIVASPLPVSGGGTGRSTLTSGYILTGNGTGVVNLVQDNSAFNKNFSTSGGSNGTSTNVAREDHYHATLTRGSYLTGSNYNGSVARTWACD
jgi:hypothetical protein